MWGWLSVWAEIVVKTRIINYEYCGVKHRSNDREQIMSDALKSMFAFSSIYAGVVNYAAVEYFIEQFS
jgi:hypothetical protein